MVKIIGALFIMIATTLVGFFFAKALRERPRQLRQLQVALQALEAEMTYSYIPLAEATYKVGKRQIAPIAELFMLFSQRLGTEQLSAFAAWKKALSEIWGKTALREREREILLQFGATLGLQDREQQKKQIILALTHLAHEEKEARDEQNRYERMCKSLGILSGGFIVILML